MTVPPVAKYSKELETAVQDDKRRQEIDSAKKRAASQNVDYESFAALVSMAHVKPFERKRGQEDKSVKQVRALPAWSFDASGSVFRSEGSQPTFNKLKVGQSDQKTGRELHLLRATGNPTMKSKQEGNNLMALTKLSLGCSEGKCMTADTFKRDWRRLGSNYQEKLTYLLALSPDELPKIFKVELPPSVLADVIEVLYWWRGSVLPNSSCTSDKEGVGEESPLQSFNAHVAFQLLKSVCACGRFSLSLKLAGTRALSLAKQLIDGLRQCAVANDERVGCMVCLSCGSEHDAKVGNVLEVSKAKESERLKEHSLCLHELKHLANVYS